MTRESKRLKKQYKGSTFSSVFQRPWVLDRQGLHPGPPAQGSLSSYSNIEPKTTPEYFDNPEWQALERKTPRAIENTIVTLDNIATS